MLESTLIEAVKAGDRETITELIKHGEDIEQKDEYGWTALNWAAGKGETEIVAKLLAAGADSTNTGRDKRSAYRIALAAAHPDCASLLKEAAKTTSDDAASSGSEYCRAYLAAELKQFPDWPEDSENVADDEVVFLHGNWVVTRTFTEGKEIIFDNVSPAWQAFCQTKLSFHRPDDLEQAAQMAANKTGLS